MRYFIIIVAIFLVFYPTSIFAQKETLEISTVFGKPGVYPGETRLATESGGVSVGYSEAALLTVPEDVLIVREKIGIGTLSPDNQLEAAGNAVIGKGYVDSSIVAPTNGLIVEGNVGIGTTGPSTELEVNGVIKANSIRAKNIAKGKSISAGGWDFNKYPGNKGNAVDSDENTATTWGTTSSGTGTLEVDLGAVYRGIAYIKFAGRIQTAGVVRGDWSVYSEISDGAGWTTIWSTGKTCPGLNPAVGRTWYVAVPFWGQIVGVKTSPIQGAPQLQVYEIYVSPYDVEP